MKKHFLRYSIIIPFFNAERFLRQCLDSVVAQTFEDWECLCIDDGSEDEGLRIAEEYAARDPRIRCVSKQTNMGVGAARNDGVKLSRGKYLVFVDADDRLSPDALQLLSEETADIVTYLAMSDKLTADAMATQKRILEVAELPNDAYAKVFDALGGNLLAWNAIYLRERMGDVEFPGIINSEDLVYSARAFAKARTIAIGLPCWYIHRNVEGSAVNSHSWRRVSDTLKSIPLIFDGCCRCIRGWRMWYVLMRKLAMHFILHVLAEIPRSINRRGSSVLHIIPGINDPTCGIAVAAKMLIKRGVGANGEVWVHSMWTPMIVKASFKALLTGKKLVRMPHGCTDPTKLKHHWYKKFWVAPVERWLFRRAYKIIATCEDEVKWIREFEPKVKKIEILPLFSEDSVRGRKCGSLIRSSAERRDRDDGELRLLYIGRLHPLKGVEFLLQAMGEYQKTFSRMCLKIIGKDEGERDKLLQTAKAYGLNIEFCGVVSEEEKERAWDWCDVLVLPTLSENFGLVVAEALVRGRRVITTDGAPAWESSVSGGSGAVVSSEFGVQSSRSGICSGYGGRLLYLKGYKDGSARRRVELLKNALSQVIRK